MWSGREADHSPPPSAEDKNTWSYTSTSPTLISGEVYNKVKDTCSWRGTLLSIGKTLPLLLRNQLSIDPFHVV
jgi:hypothetical protein